MRARLTAPKKSASVSASDEFLCRRTPAGIQRELGCNARAAPATVSGMARIETTDGLRRREGDVAGSREPGDLLIAVVHRSAGVC